MAMVKCKGCDGFTPEHDTLEGCCMFCASQRIRWYDKNRIGIHKALEPIAEWYGGGIEGNRSDIEILADAIADLQKDRTQVLQLQIENKQLKEGISIKLE